MKKLYIFLSMCLLSLCVIAQTHVDGIVVDESGEAIIGATVAVTGSTTIGTVTDYDGEFELDVPDDAKTLTVSYIGRQTQQVAIKKHLRITLKEATETLEEVVAVAYGTVTKGSFTGKVTQVNAEDIEKKSPTEITKALAGEAAGVQVVNTSGQPGTNASIRIRGIGSVNAGTAPLYVVDGVPYSGDISAIDPSDIASTTILKDATATSLYGSRGANGVILITTKKGTTGEEGKIDVDFKYGANMHLLPMYDVIETPEEYLEMCWQGIYNNLAGSYTKIDKLHQNVNAQLFSSKGIAAYYNIWDAAGSALIDGYTGKIRPNITRKEAFQNIQSWKSAIFRVGQKMDASIKISGGTEKTTYYTSFGYLKDEGYYIGSDYQRFTVRSNIEHQAKKWLKGGLNLAYTYSVMNAAGQDSNMNNGFAYVNGIPPIYPVYLYNPDGSIMTDPRTGSKAYDYGLHEGYGRGFGSGINPAGSLRYDRLKQKQHQVAGTAYFEIKFYKDLKFTANLGLQYLGIHTAELTNKYYGDAAGIGRIYNQQNNYLSLTANQLLEYNKDIDVHTIRAFAGHETNFVISSSMVGGKSHIADPNGLELGNGVQMSSITSATVSEAIESYFASFTYEYDRRYHVMANYRADGSSKFRKGRRWGHFGSVGFGWSMSNEQFLSDQDWFKDAKLRASWGMMGNQDVGMNLFEDQYSIENMGGEVSYVWGYKGNPDLTWERSQIFDLGLEFSINKYLEAEIDYFYKYTDNMLFPLYVAPSRGYTYMYNNGGAMENQGLEFEFKIHAVDKRNVKLDIRLNGAHYANKVKKLPKALDTEESSEMIENGGLIVGKSLYDYQMYEYAGVDPEEGTAQYKAYYDADMGNFSENSNNEATAKIARGETTGDNFISDVYMYQKEHPNANIQETVTGSTSYAGYNFVGKSAIPALDGGFGFDLEVYGVSLSASFSYRIGGYGYDYQYQRLMHSDLAGSYNWHKDMRGAWQKDPATGEVINPNSNIPRLSNGTDTYANASSTRWLVSNSYLSLNNVRLGYKFPKKLIQKIKLNILELYVSGDNLAIITARKGYNPMTSFAGMSNDYQYTPLSTVMGGIKFQF